MPLKLQFAFSYLLLSAKCFWANKSLLSTSRFYTAIILFNTDRIWREHLQKMTLLREAVGWRGYGQRNPLYEYKQDAFYMFETREELLRHLVIYDLLRSSIL